MSILPSWCRELNPRKSKPSSIDVIDQIFSALSSSPRFDMLGYQVLGSFKTIFYLRGDEVI